MGELTVAVPGEEHGTARAAIAARFDPLAGHLVWTGRVVAEYPPRTVQVLTAPHGNARVRGLDRPPFPVELLRPPCARAG